MKSQYNSNNTKSATMSRDGDQQLVRVTFETEPTNGSSPANAHASN